MENKLLTIGSITAVVVLILAGLSPVVGYQTGHSSNHEWILMDTIRAIENNDEFSKDSEQLPGFLCDCEEYDTFPWDYTGICTILFLLLLFPFAIWVSTGMYPEILDSIIEVGKELNCYWIITFP